MKRVNFVLAIALLLTACTAKPSLADEILGTWKNTSGFTVQFKSGGTGFIPGVPGAIPDSTFTYTVIDESHIKMDAQGQVATIQIAISGDRLTWTDALGEVTYTRVK